MGACRKLETWRPVVPDVAEYVPTLVLPVGWSCEHVVLPGGIPALAYTVRLGKARQWLRVLATLDTYEGGGLWLHTSTSRRRTVSIGEAVRIPSWDQLKLVHQVVHRDRPVVQLLPPQKHWMDISECLHLWERLDAPTVPEVVWRHPR